MRDDLFFHAKRRLIFPGLSILLVLATGLFAGAMAMDDSGVFQALKKRLVADGFDLKRIDTIFASPAVTFEEGGVSAYFIHNEAKLNYAQFTLPWSIASARSYMQAHQYALDSAQNKYGVDKEVITAIILVETKLGTYTGNKSVINTLSTLSAMAEAVPRQMIWNNLPDDDRRMSRAEFEKKADQKASWAYQELKAFLTYTQKEGLDPTTIKGSYAGAMGISQFMPSNIGPFGQDGNADGKVDLFVHADAISSIAAYLKNYGWKPGMTGKAAYDVVYHYNHSKYYVNTILEIAEKLKG
ncbi:MltB [Desulfosarcina cetonica]|uniref:lytic murein transglycosylase n=1 Tax=Desulfosarcina cetonica TaxID=90730 RepID=UPI0006CF823A|nr:lytic murein transglycosylase [Desulfosarcina cetonica]VTR69843.1 MltB [Desulfosarcina cetonica]